MSWILSYLKGVDDEPSSKRLLGVLSGIIFSLLCFIGGIVELKHKQYGAFDNILMIASGYSAALLGVSVFERYNKIKSSSLKSLTKKTLKKDKTEPTT